MEPPDRRHPVVYRMCIHLTKETNMQVPFKDKKEYLKDELKNSKASKWGGS